MEKIFDEDYCGNCKFHKDMVDNYVRCRRYPEGVRKARKEWCGEYKPEDK